MKDIIVSDDFENKEKSKATEAPKTNESQSPNVPKATAQEIPETKKSKRSGTFKRVLISLFVVGLIGAGAWFIVKNQPKNVAISAVGGAFGDILERDEITPMLNMLNGGSLAVELKGLDDGETDFFERMGMLELGGKIYFSEDNKIYVQNIGADFDDLSIRADAYISNELAYVENDLLGGAYGVEYDDAVDAFKDSIFHSESASDFSFSKEKSKQISEMLDSLSSMVDVEDFRDDLSDLIDYYVKEFWDIFCESVNIDSETRDVKVGRENVDARVVFFTFDNRDLVHILGAFADFVERDDRLWKFVNQYDLIIEAAIESLSFMSEYLYPSDAESATAVKVDADDFVDSLVKAIDDYAKSVKGSFKSVTVEIVTPKFLDRLLKFSILTEYETDNTEEIVFDFGKDGVAHTNRIEIAVKSYYKYADSDGVEKEHKSTGSLIYSISKNDSTGFACSLKSKSLYDYSVNGLVETSENLSTEILSVEINKNRGKFNVEIGDASSLIRGKWSQDGDTTTIIINEILIGYDAELHEYGLALSTDLKITLDGDDTMPSAESFRALDDLDESVAYRFKNELEKALDKKNLLNNGISAGEYVDLSGHEISVNGQYLYLEDPDSGIKVEYIYSVDNYTGLIELNKNAVIAPPDIDSDIILDFESDLHTYESYDFNMLEDGFVLDGIAFTKK